MMASTVEPRIKDRIAEAERIYLFLDYDGTLAEFSPTPEHILVADEVVGLLDGLVKNPHVRTAIVSGRRLKHIRALIPVEGLVMAGTYGIELVTAEGEQVDRLAFQAVRPALEALKPKWEALIAGHEGFFLEDKGWALAIHAKFVDDHLAEGILAAARQAAEDLHASPAPTEAHFRLLGGHKFEEIGPGIADKGQTVDYLLEHYPFPNALPIFFGDDDKDEKAFAAIHRHGGLAGLVAPQPRPSQADFRLASPSALRAWLRDMFFQG